MHQPPANAGADALRPLALQACRLSWTAHICNTPQTSPGRLQILVHCSAGLYADLDFHSLKDSTELLQGQEVLLGALVPHEHAQMLPNAWLASAHAGHPFWLFCVAEIIERARA